MNGHQYLAFVVGATRLVERLHPQAPQIVGARIGKPCQALKSEEPRAPFLNPVKS